MQEVFKDNGHDEDIEQYEQHAAQEQAHEEKIGTRILHIARVGFEQNRHLHDDGVFHPQPNIMGFARPHLDSEGGVVGGARPELVV